MAHEPDTFPEQVAAQFADAARVGEGAQSVLRDVRQAMARGDSPSPARLALVVGATRLSPVQAAAIADFYASIPGQRWLAIRMQAFPRVEQRFASYLDALRQRGFVTSVPDLPGLVLPRATFDQPPAERGN